MSKKAFLTSYFLKLILVVIMLPVIQQQLFIPFLHSFQLGLDPWNNWLRESGSTNAFPYGLFMILFFLPSKILGFALAQVGVDAHLGIQIGFALTILLFDFLIGYRLLKLKKSTKLQYLYLASPLVVWVNYIHGQTDIIPAYFLFLAGLLFLEGRFIAAGLALGVSIGTKFSLILAIPFIFVYLLDNPRIRKSGQIFLTSAVGMSLISYSPAVYSDSFRTMVLGTPESKKLFEYAISLGNYRVLVFPAVYLMLLYLIWKAGRTSPKVLFLFISISLIILAILTPASIGWSLWGIPLLILMSDTLSISAITAMWVTSFGIVALHFGDLQNKISLRSGSSFEILTSQLLQDCAFTVVLVISVQLFLSILRQAVSVGDIYGIATKPLSVSIAGDSGVGKDTLAIALSECFGVNSTVIIPGDGYHRFERGDSRWKAITHLNPDANDLWLWSKHLNQALARLNFSYRDYDHSNGRFKNKVPSNRGDLVISQGLHGLYSELSEVTDLRIYLSMDEVLREKLKVNRDVAARSSTVRSVRNSISLRRTDFIKYVNPQREMADLRIHIAELDENSFKLLFNSRTPSMDDQISKLLVAISNLECRSITVEGQVWKSISMSGLGFSEMESLFRASFDHYNQLFAFTNKFSGGMQGILQYIVFMNLESKRRSTRSA